MVCGFSLGFFVCIWTPRGGIEDVSRFTELRQVTNFSLWCRSHMLSRRRKVRQVAIRRRLGKLTSPRMCVHTRAGRIHHSMI
ncbi:hypothetical protein BD311DRAFT_309340 [Dichomitus squalens]|uniref:Uncharacterized protein n=1 Tax=Dichomitus squalens TaxID=114155 RepID=A0A4Q9MNT0_9APHY|nr:hypothetical protein BD311DRAFT_309340 [Dichomitus squalens]